MSTREAILVIASAVRRALEECSANEYPQYWGSFPRGTCGDTALVLGAFLVDAGYIGFEYICGEMQKSDGSSSSHAWLQRNDFVIDITADQFHDMDAAVIVSENSAWHRKFRISQRTVGDFRQYPVEQVVELYRLHGNLMTRLGK
jgi:hypothetical protein